ncbi:MFS transporter [Bosea sp. SSUT16]|uniref:MFS transporter n=1 Tax=Bosea spartocytisi TaxID=2773451 RepID=A0A927EDJ5_9HYPH|nr:MFS transporter [Bosea spartocytisi]MBD3848452.1 MFS transporter [Bosea spartocytisi]MCT4472801.1 MFS transporter [Bosea spartocytisi]
MPSSSRFSGHGPLLCGLVATRLIGWGTTFYSPSVLMQALDRDLGLNAEIVFGGITILLVTGALVAPAIGRVLDREGTRRSMCVGAIICALGFAVLSMAQGPISYLASWFVIGIGHAMSLANVGNVAVAQLMGERTRRVIGLMMLVTGLSSSLFWPLTAILMDAFGWRATLLVFAAMQLFIVLPIYAAVPRFHGHPTPAAAGTAPASSLETGRVEPGKRRMAFWLTAFAFSASGLVSWGLPLHLISLFREGGLTQTEAVWIATLGGPATIVARAIDATLGERLPVERVALFGLLLGPLCCLILPLAPTGIVAAGIFVAVFNAALGVISVARATLPLALFGRRGFAAMLGQLTVPQNIAFAVAPLLFAVLIERLGASATLIFSAVIQFFGFFAMLALARMLARAPAVSQ